MPPVNSGLRARFDDELATFLAARRDQLAAIDPGLEPVSAALQAFVLEGGKRLRPAFGYWAYRGCGGVDGPGVITALAALELLHAGALIHDDVMDSSDTRRGAPAIHRQFGARHTAGQWSGDPDGFGEAAAILLGDLCLVWSDEMFHGARVPHERLDAAQPYYDAMRTEVMAGQYLDVLSQARGDDTTAQASRVATYKSAKYTVERPLLMGGALGGASEAQMAAFSAYGVPVGEAFQLRDDILGVYGDPSRTGKPAGGDLREGKRTYLVASAIETGDEPQRATLRRLLGDPALDDAGVGQLQRIITETGALARTEQRIESLTAAALHALDSVTLSGPASQALRDLATASAQRAT